jgi:hypothetical protein
MKALKKTEINKPTNAKAVVQQLNKLHTQREQFEINVQARSNEKLYEICGLIYAKDDKSLLKEVVDAMKKHFEERGQRVQNNSSILGLFVRYVFNGKRQAMHIYTRALQFLLAESVKPDQAASFIAKKGGIDECFKSRTPSATQAAMMEKIDKAMPLVEEALNSHSFNSIGKVKVPPHFVAATHKEGLTFLIGRADVKGNVEILSVVPTTTKGMVSIAKKSLAVFLSEHQELALTSQKVSRKSNAIAKAAATATKKNLNAGTATMEEAAQ